MPENDKPERKTWRMLKKASLGTEFTTNILPTITTTKKNEWQYIYTAEDSYGTWKYFNTGYNGYAFADFSQMLDHKDETYSTHKTSHVAGKQHIEIDPPVNTLISLNEARLRVKAAGPSGRTINFWLKGYDPVNEAWEQITDIVNIAANTEEILDLKLPSTQPTKFYSKFSFHLTYNQTDYYKTAVYLYALEFNSGRIDIKK